MLETSCLEVGAVLELVSVTSVNWIDFRDVNELAAYVSTGGDG